MHYILLFVAVLLLAVVSIPCASLPAQKSVDERVLRFTKNNKIQPYIVNGTETGVNEFPMMAGLVNKLSYQLFCGATLVSAEFVVTAAHCLLRWKPNEVAVLVGDHDISTGIDTDATDLIPSNKIIVHPQYNLRTNVNDIGLVRLSRPAVFSYKVHPACLPFFIRGWVLSGIEVVVLGWGATEFGGPSANRLQKTLLTVQDHAKCRDIFSHQLITDEQLCTSADGTDACTGDSGGPLLWLDPYTGRHILVGVISYGVGCAWGWPGVNTRVDAFLDWMQKETRASFCT